MPSPRSPIRSSPRCRDSDVIELDGPPAFNYGERVRSRKQIRNDGTFAGREIGDVLVKKGDWGYVTSIGTFLNQFYIYGVEFVTHGYRVGMKRAELDSLDAEADDDDDADAPAMDAGVARADAGDVEQAAIVATTQPER
jgi:nitrogen fixation protein NifZ